MADLTGQMLGKYEITGRLGSGGMSRVYKAQQPGLNRTVAIKVLHSHLADEEGFVSRFEREAASIAQLRHPNITQLYDYDHDVGQSLYYMVMEYIGGPSLKSEIEQRRQRAEQFSLDEIVRIFNPLASAVEYAHSQGMIHRDIKPANIMFNSQGQVVLADFGLVHLANESHISVAGTIAGTPYYMSPEQARGESGDSRTDIYSLGVVLFELATMQLPFEGDTTHSILLKHISDPPPSPIDLNAAVPPALETVILKALEKNPDDRYQTAGEMAYELRLAAGINLVDWADSLVQDASTFTYHPGLSIRRLRSTTIPDTPYRGLYAFREQDADFFFGRAETAQQLIGRVTTNPLIALLGASGSGKSSVVFAGLVPHLRAQDEWLIVDLRPGSRPFQALAAALAPLLEPDKGEIERLVEIRRLQDLLQSGQLELNDIVQALLRKYPPAHKLLLIIDQFEELYTLTTETSERTSFLDMLIDHTVTASGERPGNLHLVFTLRADFLGQLLEHRPLADALQNGSLMLGPMTRAELHDAVEKPALKQKIAFEDGLVKRILDDVGDEPGNLPLLEFALTTLWERQEFGQLTHNAYEEIGHVEGALARYADDVFAALEPAEQEQARAVFVQMVRPGEGTEDTRRVATRPEIGESNWPLVQKLADARLIVTNRDPAGVETAEVVHEALIRGWGLLRNWMNTNRTFRAWQERLRHALRQWQESQRDPGALLRGAPLAEAEGWYSELPERLTTAEREYIHTSVTARDAEKARQDQEQRARERLRLWLTIVSVIGAIAAIGLSVWALSQRNAMLTAQLEAQASQRIADEQRQRAESAQATAVAERDLLQVSLSQQLAIQSSLALNEQLDLASLLAIEAFHTNETLEARRSLLDVVVQQPNLLRYLSGHTDRVQTVAFSPDGRLIATGSSDSNIILWDGQSGQQEKVLEGHTSIVNTLTFSPNGRWLVSGGNDRQVIVWDLSAQPSSHIVLENGHTGLVLAVQFTHDGALLATAGAGGKVLLWDTNTWQRQFELDQHQGDVMALAFHPHGRWLASAGSDQTVILWDVINGRLATDGGTPLEPLTEHTAAVTALAFAPDGNSLVSGDRNQQLFVWNTGDWSVQQRLSGHNNWLTALVFQPNGRLLASADRDGRIFFWNTTTWQQLPTTYNLHRDWVSGIEFSPDGQRFVSASYDQQAILWLAPDPQGNLTPPAIAHKLSLHTDWVLDAAFTPDGSLMASAGRDGQVILWNTTTWEQQTVLNHNAAVRAVAFSPDGALLAYGSEDATVTFWDVANGRQLGEPLKAHRDFVQDLQFSPDSSLLASSSDDETIIIWDVAKREPLVEPLRGHEGTIWEVAFSPDGRQLVSAGRDGLLIFWDMATFTPLGEPLQAHNQSVNGLSFKSDGSLFATAGDDEVVRVWNATTKELLYTLDGDGAKLETVVFSPTGRWLAAAGDSNEILLWEVASGERLNTTPLQAHRDWIFALAYSPDSTKLVSTGRDNQLFVWNMAVDAWKRQACTRANRNLTEDEWQRYFGQQTYRTTCRP